MSGSLRSTAADRVYETISINVALVVANFAFDGFTSTVGMPPLLGLMKAALRETSDV